MPCHDSLERKLASAALLRQEAGIGRDILVDDLAGTVHRAYGLMPNMTWVIDRGGRVAYKANWTSAANVEAFLGRFLAGRGQRTAGGAPVIYATEQIEFRHTDRERFTRHLLRNGPRAAAEFEKAQQMWASRSATRRTGQSTRRATSRPGHADARGGTDIALARGGPCP